MAIQSQQEANDLVTQIRSGNLGAAEEAAAMQSLREWHDQNVSSNPDTPEGDEQKKNFFERMGENIDKRQMMFTDIAEATANGEQSYGEGALQVAGKFGAGVLMDFVGEAVVSGGRGLSFITPDIIEDPLKAAATKAGIAFLETDAGQAGLAAAIEGMESYQGWAEANPRAARNVEAVVNIGLLAAPVKGKPKGNAQTGSRLGDRIRLSADRTELNRRDDFVRRLVAPPASKLVREDQVLRTSEKGLFQFKQVNPTKTELSAEQAVWGLEGVTPAKSLVGNARVVKEAIAKEGAALEKALSKKDVAYKVSDLESELAAVTQKLRASPAVVGDAEKAAEKIIDNVLTRVRADGGTASVAGAERGLLSNLFKVRKDVDQAFIQAGRPPNRYAELGSVENGQAFALRELRGTINKFVGDRARVEVQGSLARQSALFRALDNIVPKAASEASSVFSRVWSHMLKILPFRGELNQLGALAWGMGGLGAGAVLGPLMSKAVFGGAGAYLTYRGLTSPQARRQLAWAVDNLRNVPGLTVNQARQLRADRAYIMDLLKDTDDLTPHLALPDEVFPIENDWDEAKQREARDENMEQDQ